jgi:TetR/AcrR family transcriptional repressor of mexJK operon
MSISTNRNSKATVSSRKHAAILDAATDHFFEKGFAATTIESIAEQAGVSKVTVYNHFGDKPALFAASVQAKCVHLGALFSLENASGAKLRDRLVEIGETMVVFLSRTEITQFDRRIAAETEKNPELGVAFLENGPWRMLQLFTQLLEEMRARGEVRIDEPRQAAEQFIAMCKGLGDMERRFGITPSNEAELSRVHSAVDVFCAAYGATAECSPNGK